MLASGNCTVRKRRRVKTRRAASSAGSGLHHTLRHYVDARNFTTSFIRKTSCHIIVGKSVYVVGWFRKQGSSWEERLVYLCKTSNIHCVERLVYLCETTNIHRAEGLVYLCETSNTHCVECLVYLCRTNSIHCACVRLAISTAY
jgi:hypothetical protein